MITFKVNDNYKQILCIEKGHFHPFEERDMALDPQDPLCSCAPDLFVKFEPLVCNVKFLQISKCNFLLMAEFCNNMHISKRGSSHF